MTERYPDRPDPELEALLMRAWKDAADPAHDIAHIRRVWANAVQIARGEGGRADSAVLMAAVVFHDLVNLPKDAPDRAGASRQSAAAAAGILRAGGMAEAPIRAVCHAIEAHSFSAGIAPETEEARILQDADRLDALGAIGLARTMMVAGQLGRPLYDPEDPGAAQRPVDDRQWALDHFPAKLLTLGEGMQTATGRAMAEVRTAYLAAFRDRLLMEIGA